MYCPVLQTSPGVLRRQTAPARVPAAGRRMPCGARILPTRLLASAGVGRENGAKNRFTSLIVHYRNTVCPFFARFPLPTVHETPAQNGSQWL